MNTKQVYLMWFGIALCMAIAGVVGYIAYHNLSTLTLGMIWSGIAGYIFAYVTSDVDDDDYGI